MYNAFQQDRVLEDLTAHCDSPPLTVTKQRDQQTLYYLRATNKIFERGILSNKRVQSTEAEELSLMADGLKHFEEWCEDVLAHGVDPDSKSFLAWQVR